MSTRTSEKSITGSVYLENHDHLDDFRSGGETKKQVGDLMDSQLLSSARAERGPVVTLKVLSLTGYGSLKLGKEIGGKIVLYSQKSSSVTSIVNSRSM
jgi:hypothetical protein